MFNVSRGVALVSQIGGVTVIQEEYAAQGNLVKDVILGSRIEEDGETKCGLYCQLNPQLCKCSDYAGSQRGSDGRCEPFGFV